MTRQTPGQEWAAQVRAAYDLNLSDDATVDIAADSMDAIAALPVSAVSERRQNRVVLLRALSQLALPDIDGTPAKIPLTSSQRGTHAASVRWAKGA